VDNWGDREFLLYMDTLTCDSFMRLTSHWQSSQEEVIIESIAHLIRDIQVLSRCS
jgi:hypothetical protein